MHDLCWCRSEGGGMRQAGFRDVLAVRGTRALRAAQPRQLHRQSPLLRLPQPPLAVAVLLRVTSGAGAAAYLVSARANFALGVPDHRRGVTSAELVGAGCRRHRAWRFSRPAGSPTRRVLSSRSQPEVLPAWCSPVVSVRRGFAPGPVTGTRPSRAGARPTTLLGVTSPVTVHHLRHLLPQGLPSGTT